MNAHESHASAITSTAWVASTERSAVDCPRFVVVVSDVSEPAALARRILAHARSAAQPVLLLGIAGTPEEEACLHRSLVTVEGFLGAQGRNVELRTESGRGWLFSARSEFGTSDQIACYEEEPPHMKKQPLSDVLASTLALPICDLSPLHAPRSDRRSILPEVAAWVGSIAVIGGFLVLQNKIILEMQGWAQNLMLLISVAPEVGLIWLWNSFLG